MRLSLSLFWSVAPDYHGVGGSNMQTGTKDYIAPPARNGVPEGGPGSRTNKRLAARFYRLKTGQCPTGQYLKWTKYRPATICR